MLSPISSWTLIGFLVAAGAVQASPHVVAAFADAHGEFDYSYRLARIDPRDQHVEVELSLPGPANTTLSRDGARVYALSPTDAALRITVFDAQTLLPLSERVWPLPPVELFERSLVEHPLRPGVLMIDRCWWLDTAQGVLIETPTSLGLRCRQFARDPGLSPDGRHLLIDVESLEGARSTVVVDSLDPRVVPATLVADAGPFLDDATVAVVTPKGIERRSIIDGGLTGLIDLPDDWLVHQIAGMEGGSLYLRFVDAGTQLPSLGRLRVDGLATVLATGPDAGGVFSATSDWRLMRQAAAMACFIGCIYVDARYTLFDRDGGRVSSRAWAYGGLLSTGDVLLQGQGASHAQVPAMRDAGAALLATALLLAAAVRWQLRARSGLR